MKKYLIFIIFIISCSAISKNGINRNQGYEIARNSIKKEYNVDIPYSKMGFYIKNKKWTYMAFADEYIYQVTIKPNERVESVKVLIKY